MRADFYGELSAQARLAEAVASNQVLLGAMSEDELRRAVTEPARLAGLRLEPGLVDVVLGEVAGEPGALPLLSHALRATWERRDGRTLTIDAYRASGGVTSAVAQSADALVETVPAADRGILRNVFLRLTELGDGVDDTRRRVPIAELVPGDVTDDTVRALLDRFADARLLTLGDGTAEVAHEVLIREWPTLRGWLEEDREGLRLHRRLGDAARIWDAAGRDATDLYRGTRLGAALEWAQAQPEALNATERAFLDASVAESERERRAQLRANRRLRALLAGAGVLLAAAAVAGLLALRESANARDSARTADAQRLGAQALIDDRHRPEPPARPSRPRRSTTPTVTRSHLLSALVRPPGALGVMQGDSDPALRAGTEPRRADARHRRRERDGRALRPAVAPEDRSSASGQRRVEALDFSPDGKLLAVRRSGGGCTRSRVRLHRPGHRTHRERDRGPPDPRRPRRWLRLHRHPVRGRRTEPSSTTFWPGGRTGPQPVYVLRFDVRSGRQLGRDRCVLAGRPPRGATVVGARVVTASSSPGPTRTRRTWWTRQRSVCGGGSRGARSPPRSRRTAAVPPLGGEDGSVALLDLRTGKRRRLAGRHDDLVQELAFSADGRTLATTGDDGRVLVWDLRRGNVRETLTGHSGRITSLQCLRRRPHALHDPASTAGSSSGTSPATVASRSPSPGRT